MIRNGIASVIGLIATIVRVVFSIIGALIIIHAVFVLFGANTHNVLVQFTAGIRDSFGWFTKNLFTPKDPKIAQAINDALAGLIWVVAGSLLSKLILRFAPAPSKSKDKGRNETPRATPVRQSKPAEKPADEPKAEEPTKEEPKADEPTAEEPAKETPPVKDEPAAQPPRAAERIAEPEPAEETDEAEAEEADDEEPRSRAKHQARATARREDDAEADDDAEAEAGDKAQA